MESISSWPSLRNSRRHSRRSCSIPAARARSGAGRRTSRAHYTNSALGAPARATLTLVGSAGRTTSPLATSHGWSGHSRRELFVYYPVDKRLLRSFPITIAVSGQIRSELIASGVAADRVRVVLNAIDHRAFRRDRFREARARRDLALST